jgi:hypothetical protein
MKKSRQQLLAKVWRPVWGRFNSVLRASCLRRDAYLDHVFADEAKALKAEIPRPNSSDARAFLQSKLEDLDRVAVNFSLSPGTVEAVNRACEEMNVVRDCFINRVLFLLSADPKTCERVAGIEFLKDRGDILGDHERDFLYAPLWGGGLNAVSEIVNSDPFWALRNVIEHARDEWQEEVEPLHACVILPSLFQNEPLGAVALNCYLPDEYVPGTPAAREADDLLVLREPMDESPRDPKPEKEGGTRNDHRDSPRRSPRPTACDPAIRRVSA